MATTATMFDQLRDLLGETAGDSQVSFALKKLWLNRGIAMLWPDIYQIVEYDTIITADGTMDYILPEAIQDGFVTSVEISMPGTSGDEYQRMANYDIIDGDEDIGGIFRITGYYPGDDLVVRIRYAAPIPPIESDSLAEAQLETFQGPDRARFLPVFYAMSMITSRKLDDRQDTYRYSTTQATNGVSDTDIMDAARFWMNQFELETEKLSRPLPIAKD